MHRSLLVKLPADIPNEQYTAIAFAVHGVLVAAKLATRSNIMADDLATDEDLDVAFDTHYRDFPWGP